MITVRVDVLLWEAVTEASDLYHQVTGRDETCPLVYRRIACDTCEYGMFEAKYPTLIEWIEAVVGNPNGGKKT
jgi:hypothetical protein